MKKGLWILIIALLCVFVPAKTQASTTNIIDINSAEDLAKIGVDSNYPTDGNYRLNSNISIDETWTSKVNSASPFTGVFDGNNKTITYTAKFSTTSIPKENK